MTEPQPVLKLIKAHVRPGRRAELLEQQRVWNDAMARQPGFLGVQVALDPEQPDLVYILVVMASRAALAAFMAGEHDAIMARTDMSALYESLEIRLLDVVQQVPPAAPRPTDEPTGASAVRSS